MTLLLFAFLILSASSLGIPLLQIGREKYGRASAYILITALFITLAIVSLNTLAPQPAPFGNLISSDRLGGFFAFITLLVSLLVAVTSLTFTRGSNNEPIYYSLLSFTALGMLLLSYTTDLLMLFIAWELMSLPTYVLAGFYKKRTQSSEAAAKYAILGALSSAIILYAISLTYGVSGTTQIVDAVNRIASQPFNPIASMAILLFLVGFGFKMSIVPFHMWVPDTYEGAPTTISTLLAAATKKAGFVAAIRVLLAVSTLFIMTRDPTFSIANILAVLALLTMTLGNVAALTQKSMTRLLAYSSIAQAGYILIGFAIYAYGQQSNAYIQDAILGMTGSLFHILNHSIMKGTAFLVAALVIYKLHRADILAYSGLGRRMPVAAFTLTIALLALAGVPPLNGFWSKLLLFMSVLNSPLAWLAVVGVVNSAFSMGYYAWIIKRMYMDEPERDEKVDESKSFVIVFIFTIALMIGLGIFPTPAISFSQSALPDIFPQG
jgi:NADH-quinone oxidoreductase subunit N